MSHYIWQANPDWLHGRLAPHRNIMASDAGLPHPQVWGQKKALAQKLCDEIGGEKQEP